MDQSTPANTRKIQRAITDDTESALKRYQRIVVGSPSRSFLLRYELSVFFLTGMNGAAGLVLRQRLFRGLFQSCGRKPVIGPAVTLRNTRSIVLGENIVLSDGAILDGRSNQDVGIDLGDRTIVGQRAMLLCKGGQIRIGSDVGIGANSGLYAVGDNVLTIGDNCLVGPYCYFGGTMYHHDRTDIPMREQGHDLRGGITVGDDCWFGAGAAIMDGVTVGRGAIVASGAVVTRDVADFTIVGGVPAKPIGRRGEDDGS